MFKDNKFRIEGSLYK